jgi:DNA-binding transcriptional regulator YiaG
MQNLIKFPGSNLPGRRTLAVKRDIILAKSTSSVTPVADRGLVAKGALLNLREARKLKRLIEDEDKVENLLFGVYRLSLIRELLNISSLEISKYLGIPYDTWKSYESGRRKLPDDLLLVIEEFMIDEVAEMSSCFVRA